MELDPLPQGSLVALYNGVKESPRLHQEWSDYRVHVNGNVDIDIPEVVVLFRPPSSSSQSPGHEVPVQLQGHAGTQV